MMGHLDTQPVESRDEFGPRRNQEYGISICHVLDGGSWAGEEVQVATLLRALSKCREVTLHAVVLHEGRLARELRNLGIDIQVVREEQNGLWQILTEASAFVKKSDTQILHSHNYKDNLIALLLSRSCGVPHLVRTEHGHPEPYSVVRNLKHWCVLAADRLAAKYTSAQIISVSSDLGEYWKTHTDPKNVAVLRNAIDIERVKSKFGTIEAKQRLGIADHNFVIGIAARLECIKRHDLFVLTAKYLAEKIPQASFLIAGCGRQKEPIQQLIVESGLQQRVVLLGERADVYDVLRAMDVLLVCSDHEGVPMVMLEAMALGVAVVSRKVGGIPEVIRNGVNGVLVPSDSPADLGYACLSLYRDSRLRTLLTQVARNEIEQQYSSDRHARKIVELYQSICTQRGRRNHPS